MFTVLSLAKIIVTVNVVALVVVSATATADPADNQANNDKLFALLAGGYTHADCNASDRYQGDPFLARLGCGRNDQPGGPDSATYSLYGKIGDLDKAFNIYVNSAALQPCPGMTDPGPIAWQGGMVKCGAAPYPANGGHMLAWTNTVDLLVASVTTYGDLEPLYAWWLSAR